MESASSTYIVKFQQGASGVLRASWTKAIDTAIERRPANVYRVGKPNVKLATVHVDGGIDYTPEGATERRVAS